MRGFDVAQVQLFFSFTFENVSYSCALVRWFSRIGDHPDDDSGMWKVEPDYDTSGSPVMAIIHLDAIFRAVHLIGVSGKHFLPQGFSFHHSLQHFHAFFVNRFADHHAFEIVS
jgi:hypothetical protein